MACRLLGAKPLSEPMCNIVNSNLRNKLQWNPNSFIQENAFENVVGEKALILSRPHCTNIHLSVAISRVHIWCSVLVEWLSHIVNTLRPSQNGRRFAEDTFKRIFLNENVRISIKISLKFIPKCPTNNIPALVQIMVWRRPGDNPLTHICVTLPQWVKNSEQMLSHDHYHLFCPSVT